LLVGGFHPQIGYELEEFTEIHSLCRNTEVSGIKTACGPLIYFFSHGKNTFIHAQKRKGDVMETGALGIDHGGTCPRHRER